MSRMFKRHFVVYKIVYVGSPNQVCHTLVFTNNQIVVSP